MLDLNHLGGLDSDTQIPELLICYVANPSPFAAVLMWYQCLFAITKLINWGVKKRLIY